MNEVRLRLLPLQIASINSLGLKEPFGWDRPPFRGARVHRPPLRLGSVPTAPLSRPTACPTSRRRCPTCPDRAREADQRRRTPNGRPGPLDPRWRAGPLGVHREEHGQLPPDPGSRSRDDQGVQVRLPAGPPSTPGESMTCTGQGTDRGLPVREPRHRHRQNAVRRRREATTIRATTSATRTRRSTSRPPSTARTRTRSGPAVEPGSPVQWTYVVTNSGDVNLAEIKVTDEKGLAVPARRRACGPASP